MLLFIVVHGLLVVVAFLAAERGFQVQGLQQLRLADPRTQAQWLWCLGLVASLHMESSWTRAWACVPASAGRFLSSVLAGKSLWAFTWK